ncbi:unnamed protein product [Candidula unifasciata]|uniref:Pecanex-like protein n=1 Tax=Candidula unifasciata TaxID=100452 RepID=A0A8S3ZFX7_9EUPU|nr:unnamed protein product [Candidula unifasciata]
MGMGVPLLNGYKRSFLLKRIPQTVLGGLKLRLGYSAPAYVYVNQVLLWLIPFLLGCIFTLVLELVYTDEQISSVLVLYSCLYGACIIIFVVIVQTITTIMEMKEKENLHAGIIRKKNSLAEEDEIEFESCCGAETFAFVIPAKRFKVNIALHALVSGVVCGLGYWYLLPYSLNNLFSYNYGATAVVFILGWFTICVAQYSLTAAAPPEPAVYRTMDTYELQPLTRPLYTLVCYSIHIASWYSTDFHLPNQVLHIVFVLLPLLWFLGVLPPGEVLILWILEQCQVFLFGGSPAASIPRLLVNVLMSAALFLGCYFLSSCFSSMVLAAGAGYLLSCDLGGLGSQIWEACQRNKESKITTTKAKLPALVSTRHPRISGFLWSWCWSTVYYHGVMTAAAAVAATVTAYHIHSISSHVVDYLGYVIIGFCVVEKLLRDFQGVFVFFGLVRNLLYPQSTENVASFRQGKRRLLILGLPRRAIINWVSPLVMAVYLSLQVVPAGHGADIMSDSCSKGMPIATSVFFVLGVVRAYRWIWQNTTQSLLEMAVVHVVLVTTRGSAVVSELGVPILLLIACVVRDRFYQLVNKLYFVTGLIVASWSYKKQRYSATGGIILLNIIFFPIVIIIVLTSTLISAPILCLFTLPLFFIGFPRPSKFWPEPVGSSANTCPDSLYYRQILLELGRALRPAFANGSLGEPQPGNHYLLRFQDRLVWVMILERGAGYCTLSIKGLELQETSCHTTEAARFDDQFGEAFEGKCGPSCVCSVNHYPLHCLTPVDAMVLRTYSDARNVLTGVIDSPDSVRITLSFFAKSLTWLLLQYVNKLKRQEQKAKIMKEKEIALMEKANSEDSAKEKSPKEGSTGSKRKVKVSVMGSASAPKEMSHRVTIHDRKYDQAISIPIKKHDVIIQSTKGPNTFAVPPISVNIANLAQDSTDANSQKGSISASLPSFSDSVWSEDLVDLDRTKNNTLDKHHKAATVVTIAGQCPDRRQSKHSVLTSLHPASPDKMSAEVFTGGKNWKDVDDLLNDVEFGLPAVDVSTPCTRLDISFDETSQRTDSAHGSRPSVYPTRPASKFTLSHGNQIYKPVMNLAGSPDFKCPFSSHISVPVKWRELPIEPSQLSCYISKFPTSWYKHTLHSLDWSTTGLPGDEVASEVATDDALTNCYSQLVMACCSAFDCPDGASGASYLYKCYNGDIPWNAMMDWLAEDKELYKLVMKAFRYGFKLMLDQSLLGGLSDDEELEETLCTYDRDWYIGKESDVEWGLAVLENRGNLFSMGQNTTQGTYTSRCLTLQDVVVHMGRINRESVISQWSSLNLELLYMTNDDEERYSIQAQPAMLRNLTVQAADPPLGYPIYSSPPVSLPTL